MLAIIDEIENTDVKARFTSMKLEYKTFCEWM
jgi:hypothetical protein